MWGVIKSKLTVLKTTLQVFLLLHTTFFLSNYAYQKLCVRTTPWGYLYSIVTHGSSTCNMLRDLTATSSTKITKILQIGNFVS